MAVSAFTGETLRINAKDFNAASLTITLYDPAGAVVGTPYAAVADSDDWFYNLALPATAGQYSVTFVSVRNGETDKHKFYVTVHPFP
jgi:hypothetical protein